VTVTVTVLQSRRTAGRSDEVDEVEFKFDGAKRSGRDFSAFHGSSYGRGRGRIAVLMGTGVQLLLCRAGACTLYIDTSWFDLETQGERWTVFAMLFTHAVHLHANVSSFLAEITRLRNTTSASRSWLHPLSQSVFATTNSTFEIECGSSIYLLLPFFPRGRKMLQDLSRHANPCKA
jgi:hypothetical protein